MGKDKDYKEAFLKASKRGRISKIRRQLKKKRVDVNCRDIYGYTALHYAAQLGHIDCVVYLLAAGANIDAEDGNQNTPLYTAALAREKDIVMYLVKNGANLEKVNGDGKMVMDAVESVLGLEGAQDIKSRRPLGPRSTVEYLESSDDDSEAAWLRKLQGEISDDEGRLRDFEEHEWSTRKVDRMTDEEWRESIARGMWEKQNKQMLEEIRRLQRIKEENQKKKEHHDAILEEEQRKDRIWRENVLMGNKRILARETYEKQWSEFTAVLQSQTPLRYNDFPWLPEDSNVDALSGFLFVGCDDFKLKKKCVRMELLRWHPDKMLSNAIYSRIVSSDRQRVQSNVQRLAQMLNDVHASLR